MSYSLIFSALIFAIVIKAQGHFALRPAVLAIPVAFLPSLFSAGLLAISYGPSLFWPNLLNTYELSLIVLRYGAAVLIFHTLEELHDDIALWCVAIIVGCVGLFGLVPLAARLVDQLIG